MATHGEESSQKVKRSVSYSQYSVYKQCPHRWYLDYAKGLRENKPSIHLIFGTALHETLQHYLKVMYDVSAAEADKIDLPAYFKDRLKQLYKENSTAGHFSTSQELSEFYEDAVAILDYVKRKRNLYFKKKNTTLVGIEVPISGPVTEAVQSIGMKGFIDLILYDKVTGKYTIYDIKTSTKGWSDYEKKDQVKVNQILLYKRFFSVLRKVPEDKIDVQFFIVRRRINENLEFIPKRVQEFIPAHGTGKVNKAIEDLQAFVHEAFTSEGEYREKIYPKNVDKCKYCPYIDRRDLCDRKNK